MSKGRKDYLYFRGNKYLLTNLDYTIVTYDLSESCRYVINLIYKDGSEDYILCSRLNELQYGVDYEISLDSNETVSLLTDKAVCMDLRDKEILDKLCQAINKYLEKEEVCSVVDLFSYPQTNEQKNTYILDGATIALSISENLNHTAKESAMFVAGFEECLKFINTSKETPLSETKDILDELEKTLDWVNDWITDCETYPSQIANIQVRCFRMFKSRLEGILKGLK